MSFQYSVSVVVPIYKVEDYLEECLDSIAAQSLDSLEVLLIDDGSPDSSPEIAQSYAANYSNFFYYRKENGGLGHARNFGTDLATGEYIAYCDSDDIIPPSAYEHMYELAKKWDCDIVSGDVDRFTESKHYASSLHRIAFAKASECENVFQNPRLLFDTIAPNKLYKASFLRDSGIRFPEDMLYEDIPTVLPLVCMTQKYAHLDEIVYSWRERESAAGKSITQRRTEWKNFSDRLKALKMVDKFFDENIRDERLISEKNYKWLSLDLRMFINSLPDSDNQYREAFMDTAIPYVESIGIDALLKLKAIDRIKYYYLLKRDMNGLLEYLSFAKTPAAYRAMSIRRQNNRFYGKFPFKVPKEFADMTTEIVGDYCAISINDVNWSSSSSLYIEGKIFPRRFDALLKDDIDLRAFLVSNKNNTVIAELPAAIAATKNPETIWLRCLEFGFVRRIKREKIRYGIEVDKELLLNLPVGKYHIEIQYKHGNTCCERILVSWPSEEGSPYPGAFFSNKERCYVNYDIDNTLTLNIDHINEPLIDEIKCEDKTLTLSAQKRIIEQYTLTTSNLNELKLTVNAINDCKYQFSSAEEGLQLLNHTVLKTCVTAEGILELQAYPLSAKLLESSFDGSAMRFKIAPLTSELSLVDGIPFFIGHEHGTQIPCSSYSFLPDGTIQCCIRITNSSISTALRSDTYYLYVSQLDRCSNPMPVLRESKTPTKAIRPFGQKFEYSFTTNGQAGFCVSIAWRLFENSMHKRNVLQQHIYEPIYKTCRHITPLKKNMVLFESYWGTQAGCSPAALSRYLTINHPEMECVWSLEDERTPVEGDVKRIRKGTLSYYLAIARAHYLVNNVNFEGWYKKRSGQIEIQTTHGTPLKTVGFAAPNEFPTQKAIDEFAQRCARWDYLVTPGPLTEEILKDNYHYTNQFLRTGFPRNDHLFERNSAKEIAELKRLYGIPQDKKLILYAPTWRKKDRFDLELDLTSMADALSQEFVIGLRPHHFSLPGINWGDIDSRVINLSAGPSSEDCYLMADVVITDYSSLMFDVTLLNKPLIFFVYDLEKYRDKLRGFNLDFIKEAPGPLLKTTPEVIDAIANLDSTIAEYEKRYKRFKEGYCGYEKGNASAQIYNLVMA